MGRAKSSTFNLSYLTRRPSFHLFTLAEFSSPSQLGSRWRSRRRLRADLRQRLRPARQAQQRNLPMDPRQFADSDRGPRGGRTPRGGSPARRLEAHPEVTPRNDRGWFCALKNYLLGLKVVR